MAEVRLTKSAIRSGVWNGHAVREDGADEPAPTLSAWHLETQLPAPELSPVKDKPGLWAVSLPIPATLLADGVQTVLIRDDTTGETVESFALVSGEPLEQDVRAESDLLRAELDMLKRAFRRHCVETG
jgi:hypothetical protein